MCNPPTFECYQSSTVVCLARVELADGSIIGDSDDITGTVKVFRLDTAEETYSSDDPTDPVIEIAALQTDRGWAENVDSAGYNISIQLPVRAFPEPDAIYQVECLLSPDGEQLIPVVWRIATKGLLSYAS